jgi:TetR/AcrR family transcriptional regulator, mexJK operon transcriptional repressor
MEVAVPDSDALTPRARAKRDQIRAGAQRVFLSRGFAAASTDAIAAEASVSKQTLYVYYPSKEELLADVLITLIRQGPSAPDAPSQLPSLVTVEALRQSVGAFAHGLIAQFMQPEYLGLLRIIFGETQRVPEVGRLFRSSVPERVLGGLAGLLASGRAQGSVRDIDLDAAPRMLVGALLTYAILGGLLIGDGPPQPPDPERIDAVVDLFVEMIRAPAP